MGDFTDLLTKGNGAGKAIPSIGSRRYELAEISFFLDKSPKEILGQVVHGMIAQAQKAGEYKLAQQLTQNPQPFYGNPGALAVFMACAVELEKRDDRIEKLEKALGGIAAALGSDDPIGQVITEHLGQFQPKEEGAEP